MNLLLDTHIWAWSLLAPERLSRRVAAELASSANELWLSPVSTWELHLLIERRRLAVDAEPGAWIAEVLRATPLREAPLTHQVALESRRLRLTREDPADRFLAATARVHDLTLVTADAHLLRAKGVPTLANR